MIDDAFGNWLAGFIDGEGCFVIARTSNRGPNDAYMTKFSLRLRSDDVAILFKLKHELGIGRLCHTRSRGRRNPSITWQVQSRSDCLALVELLERYPLRAKKSRDFEIWKKAVRLWSQAKRGGRGPRTSINSLIWEEMGKLYSDLMIKRAFS